MSTSSEIDRSASGGTGPAAEEPFHWGDLGGVSIDFPMWVERMHGATIGYTVDLDPAQALIPGDAFRVAEVAPGQASLVVALVDYIENPWGDYGEVNLGFLAHPADQPERIGAFVYRMPVDQEFTKEAGNRVLGLPKTVEELDFAYTDDRVTVRLVMGGQPALTVSLPRAAGAGAPEMTEAITYSYLDGVPTELPLGIQIGTGLIDPAEVELELGTAPVADELRSLGLPRAADFAVWGEDLRGVFGRPRPV